MIGDNTVTAYSLGTRGDIRQACSGTAVPDRLASYWTRLPDKNRHGLCNAYPLRSGNCSRPAT